jgi:capsular exopolysaccharide synthesis family protein
MACACFKLAPTRPIRIRVSHASDLEVLLRTLRRHALLIVLSAIAAAATTWGVSSLEQSRYETSSTLLFTSDRFSVNSALEPERRLSTLVVLAQSDQVLQGVGDAMGEEWPRDRVAESIDVRAPSRSELIVITATAPSPEDAARLANETGRVFVTWRLEQQRETTRGRISSLRSQLNALAGRTAPSDVAAAADLRTQLAQAEAELQMPTADVTLVEPARVPTSAVSPKPIRNAFVGFTAGLVIGLVLAGIRERMDHRLRYLEEVERAYGAPVVGVVPFVRRAAKGERSAGLADFSASSLLADAYRTIRTNVELTNIDGARRHVIVVSSAVPSEGKSGVVANLAVAFASAGRRVLIISADLRSPSLHEYFGLAPGHGEGLLEALWGERALAETAEPIQLDGAGASDRGGISLLATRHRPSDPASLVHSNALAKLIEDARNNFDVILIDSPPLLIGAEATALARRSDGLLIVSRIGTLMRGQAHRAAKVISSAAIVPVGVIVTGRLEGDTGYRYGYDYASSADEAEVRRVASGAG